MNADYSQMTNEDFQEALEKVLDSYSARDLLNMVHNIHSEVSEYFNNEVLDQWAENNPEKAYPEEKDE